MIIKFENQQRGRKRPFMFVTPVPILIILMVVGGLAVLITNLVTAGVSEKERAFELRMKVLDSTKTSKG